MDYQFLWDVEFVFPLASLLLSSAITWVGAPIVSRWLPHLPPVEENEPRFTQHRGKPVPRETKKLRCCQLPPPPIFHIHMCTFVGAPLRKGLSADYPHEPQE
ncbi:hypothetical protein DPX39_070022000 [Trypanosoma brucei equiperdum]|uniref:Uncharacterized protein n=1 Tax=Trypanosoma brucei equiperdum TaxID=630700 RepID=A0A3L6L5E5_9TRYP|nr:hypothetical protein DPX39_070022000 [Trypanosoma brucei equiperdum]